MVSIPDENNVTFQFLGRSGLKVSNLCLGTMTFGESSWGLPGQSDEDLSHQILNRYAEWGGNFLDTADVYGLGKSETIVGKWLQTQPRDKFVIATKCGFNMGKQEDINNVGLSRRRITESIDLSLQRLHTDFVDLYQTHIFDDGTPLEETLRTLDDLVRVGKIRYIGLSNVTGWQVQKLVDTTQRLGLNSVVSLQQQYNLLTRESEFEAFQVCKNEGLGLLPWSPLKWGILTGKLTRGVTPTEGRAGFTPKAFPFMSDLTDRAFDIVDTVKDIAKKHGRSVPQVAIRWLLQKDVVTSVIVGARTLQQLDDNMAAANGWSLTKEEMQRLDDVSAPKLLYPYDMVFTTNENRRNPTTSNFYVKSTL
ncbi:unnamed protein product [Candidula unifasciata]|uniref:NADP-dependent oxidoreductase domain-containing protein n=1 Tax=Candidula unifasciata TaxID=100452 RepID=A0A8S3Z4X1_9EUPU|nr:unnamed protein product [Candidula unifasciata]